MEWKILYLYTVALLSRMLYNLPLIQKLTPKSYLAWGHLRTGGAGDQTANPAYYSHHTIKYTTKYLLFDFN